MGCRDVRIDRLGVLSVRCLFQPRARERGPREPQAACVAGSVYRVPRTIMAQATLGPHFAPSLTAKLFNFIRLELV